MTPLAEAVTTDASQFARTAADVADYLRKHGRVPSSVWLGSTPVPPEAYLRALAEVAPALADGKPLPETIEVKPAKLAAAKYVADDDPKAVGLGDLPAGLPGAGDDGAGQAPGVDAQAGAAGRRRGTMKQLLVLGATGVMGRCAVALARRRLRTSRVLQGLPRRPPDAGPDPCAVDIHDPNSLRRALADVQVVINAVGPFDYDPAPCCDAARGPAVITWTSPKRRSSSPR